MLDGDGAAVHLVLEALHGRAAEMPGEARPRRPAVHDLVGEEGVEIVHRVDLGGGGMGPCEAEELQAALHLGEHENGFFPHRLRASLAPADGALAVAGAALPGLAAARYHEGRRLL